MGVKGKKNRKIRGRQRIRYHKRSMAVICGILFLLVIVISVSSFALGSKTRAYIERETELKAELEEEEKRGGEIEKLEEYVGTDEYIEQTAKDKLGLIHENEIILKAK